ncbi:MAG: CHAT domain-containing protein [Synechococcales bacterium]|nr:CHAT domain-containing protein [Synechococcales bacterium]
MKILFLAANPDGTSFLHLDEEVHRIEDSLRKSRLRDQFQFETKWAVNAASLRQALLEEDPDIVHFSGHGEGQSGLVLVGQGDEPKPATADALSALFKLFPKIKCVLLNACYAEEQARAIVQHVGYVIGMKQSIKDDAAIAFSTGFYDGLGYGKSIETAFELGCVAIQFEMADFSSVSRKFIPIDVEDTQNKLVPLADHLIPVLLKREETISRKVDHFPEKQQTFESLGESADQQYRERIREFLQDEKLTNTEIFQLATLANVLKIPQSDAHRMIEEEQSRIQGGRSHSPQRPIAGQFHSGQSVETRKPIGFQSKTLIAMVLTSVIGIGSIAYYFYAIAEPDPPVKNETQEVSPDPKKQEIVSTLDNYNIGICYLDSVAQLQEEGTFIKQELIEYGLSENRIQVRGLPQSWFDSTGGLSSDQIRYESGTEDQAAQALKEALAQSNIARNFNLQTIRGSSPNSISIFLHSQALTLSRSDLRIHYFPQEDEATVADALSPFGEVVELGVSAQAKVAATNAIWFGSQASLEDVKLVAEKLLKAGVPIQSIRPFRTDKPLIIQVGADRELPEDGSVWTVEAVRQASDFRR